MEKESRAELLKILEKEREKLHRYETKLKDLVVAYKSQVKENETLQATISSLRASRRPLASDEAGSESSDTEGASVLQQQQQEEVERLTNSMTELIQEKKLIQSAAIAERKALKQEYEDRLTKLQAELEETAEEKTKLSQQVSELRKKVRSEQMDREKEQTDHAAIIREHNKNLNDLMVQKDDLKHQLLDLRKELEISTQVQPSQTENYEVIIADLTNQLQEMRVRVKDSENRANQQVILGELQQQISDIKQHHAESLIREQHRADEAETKLMEIGRKSEKRISELENKVSQLSDMVGNYEKLRTNDQQAIQKLKTRVTQLDIENTALAKVANPQTDSNLTIEELVDKLKQLKGSLKTACEELSSPPADYHVKLGEVFLDETHLHKRCDEEYSQLKDEFERYKLRAQSVLKNKSSKDHTGNKEVDDLKNIVVDLRDKLRLSADKHNTDTQSLHQTISELRQSIANLHAKHSQELSVLTADCQSKVNEAELRLHQHRDRTISLLAEKDREIEILTSRLRVENPTDMDRSSDFTQPELASPVEQLFTTEHPMSGQMIHFQQEIARSQQEMAALRKQKRELEVALDDLQSSVSVKQEQADEQIALLKEEVHRLDRNKSREGVNLEYLKNVVYRYMIANDPISKHSIFNAISTILHFSPQEKKIVMQRMDGYWEICGFNQAEQNMVDGIGSVLLCVCQMRFRFCGGLDCPDWVLAEITILARMSSIKMKLLSTQTVKSLLGEDYDYDKVKKYTSDAKYETGDVKAALAVLSFILSSAARYDVDSAPLSDELQQLGLPKEHSVALCKVYADNSTKLQDHFKLTSLKLSTVEKVEYEVKHALDPSGQHVLEEPLVQLKLTIKDTDQSNLSKLTSSRLVNVTLTSPKFQVFLHELKQAQDEMKKVADSL